MTDFISRRRVIKGALAAAVAPMLQPYRVLAQSPDDYASRYVHPEYRDMARQIQKFLKMAPLTDASLPQMRATNAQYARSRLVDVRVEKKEIAGAPGQPAVTIYVVNAKPGADRPGILHTHGGGFVAGSANASVSDVQAVCKELGCAAVTVEYRLAPETTYRGSIEDNYAALKWLHAHAVELGVDPARIAVMGESAGGGHAAILAIVARDRGEVPVAFQCLIYPMLDDRTGSSRRMPDHVGKIIWTPESNRYGWRSFLGSEPGVRAHSLAVPARIDNLVGLPPAFIGVGSIDLFHEEDVEFARRLNRVGVPAELIVVPGAFHGFDTFPTKIAAWFNAAKFAALRRGLGLAIP